MGKLIHALKGDHELVRAYYYGSMPVPKNPAQEAFYAKLEHLHIMVTVLPLKSRSRSCKKCGNSYTAHIEKGVDVALVTDLLKFGYRSGYDVALLVSGDNDFAGAIQEVRDIPKNVIIAAFNDSISQETRRKADQFISLDALTDIMRRK